MAFFSFAFGFFFFCAATSLFKIEANPSSFQFESFEKTPKFLSQISLHGDAKIINSSVISSNGGIMHKIPISFLGTSPGFSTDFSFSIPESNREQTLAFLMGHGVLSVEFGNSVRINVDSEVSKSSNLSAFGLVLNSGQKLHCWINYSGFSKRLEVRLNTSSAASIVASSLISYHVDLSNLLWREAMLVGISCSNPNSIQFTSIYSWRFVAKHGAPYLLHSEPLDPSLLMVRSDKDRLGHIRSEYFPWRIVVATVVGAAFGALVMWVVLILRSSVAMRHLVVPVEYSVNRVGIGFEKMVLDGSKAEGNVAAK